MTQEPDPWIEAITAERIERALAGFTLEMATGWNAARLAGEIRPIANLGRDILRIGPNRQKDCDARTELEDLSRQAQRLLTGLEEIGFTSEIAVLGQGMYNRQAVAGEARYDNEAYRTDFLEPLRHISHLLSLAAADVNARPKQESRWTKKEAKVMRIRFAVSLTPVFEAAFDQAAVATNWAETYGKAPHPWRDFFERIHGELFGLTKGLNVREVLQAAFRVRAGKPRKEDLGCYPQIFPRRMAS